MKNFIPKSITIIFLLFLASFSFGQKSNNNIADSVEIKKHSPRLASYFSIAIPGMGQAYNKKYWKIPVIYAGFGTLIYFADKNNNYYQQYKTAYNYRIDNDTTTVDSYPWASEESLLNQKDYWRRNRDLCYIGVFALYILNIIDASVDANFYDYDISDDLSLRVEPMLVNPKSVIFASSTNNYPIGIRCTIRF
ncbi:MAG: hypothetical protein KAG95_00870 [Bacteroidales bacterium]|nr:hypothetical protein [Bacteroidales bacterium]